MFLFLFLKLGSSIYFSLLPIIPSYHSLFKSSSKMVIFLYQPIKWILKFPDSHNFILFSIKQLSTFHSVRIKYLRVLFFKKSCVWAMTSNLFINKRIFCTHAIDNDSPSNMIISTIYIQQRCFFYPFVVCFI